jgi:hypothetical protein|tara:strand:+ start:330 stop:581 length:252 start_codon:yes stop_codon:yes gene_type:complete
MFSPQITAVKEFPVCSQYRKNELIKLTGCTMTFKHSALRKSVNNEFYGTLNTPDIPDRMRVTIYLTDWPMKERFRWIRILKKE